MIRIIERESCWRKAYAFACTVNRITTPFRIFSKRTRVSSRLNRLKYKGDLSVIPLIVSEVSGNSFICGFLEGGILIPVPPSKERKVQPVYELSRALAGAFNLEYIEDAIPCIIVDITESLSEEDRFKSREHPQHYVPSTEVLSSVDRKRKIILFDDLYDTGATMMSASRSLSELGFTDINVFTLGYSAAARKRFMKNRSFIMGENN